jgi:regulator of protease activity HflC (stomatin/prohibitin superfamily)
MDRDPKNWNGPWIRAIIIAGVGVTLLIAVMSTLVGYTFIRPGYVGVKVNLYGSNRGVQDLTIVTGRVIYLPFTTQIYDFPTFLQQVTWTASRDEGGASDQSITFVSKDRIRVSVDVSAAYSFERSKIPALFQLLRITPEEIQATYMRSRVRDAFTRNGSSLDAMDILGAGVASLDTDVTKDLNQELDPIGIKFDYVSVINKPRLPPQIEKALEDQLEMQQTAKTSMYKIQVAKNDAEQRVASATADADAARAKAAGIADANVTTAQGEAKAILVKAQAQAQANQLLSAATTPILVQMKLAEQWNGAYPSTMLGGTPNLLLNMGGALGGK